MATSLFTTPLATVTVDHVHAFLDLDLEEGPLVDYKAFDSTTRTGISDTVYRAVCAFANTYGGLIIVGVSVDEKTNRPAKREGIPLKPGLEEAVTSKCQSLIFPPVAPEVTVCPFKTDETLPQADRAFVVVRVSASLATPHQMQKDNRILVRVGSECRDPDLATLRALFDRADQQEERTKVIASHLQNGAARVRNRLMVPGGYVNDQAPLAMPSSQFPPRLAPGSHRVGVEWVPIDAIGDLLSFWTHGAVARSPDEDLLQRLKAAKWHIEGVQPGDVVRLPRGLGVGAIYLTTGLYMRRILHMEEPDTNANPVDIIYVDSSGGMFLDMATASLGASRPPDELADVKSLVTFLVERLDTSTQMLCALLREQGYGGRLQITAWVDTGYGFPSYDLKAQGHRGSMAVSVVDTTETIKEALAPLLSQLTRSWLNYPFTITGWTSQGEPIIRRL